MLTASEVAGFRFVINAKRKAGADLARDIQMSIPTSKRLLPIDMLGRGIMITKELP
jgi:hypothetical protein